MDEYSPATVLVSHHVEEIPPGFTHALLLREGSVVASGPLARGDDRGRPVGHLRDATVADPRGRPLGRTPADPTPYGATCALYLGSGVPPDRVSAWTGSGPHVGDLARLAVLLGVAGAGQPRPVPDHAGRRRRRRHAHGRPRPQRRRAGAGGRLDVGRDARGDPAERGQAAGVGPPLRSAPTSWSAAARGDRAGQRRTARPGEDRRRDWTAEPYDEADRIEAGEVVDVVQIKGATAYVRASPRLES